MRRGTIAVIAWRPLPGGRRRRIVAGGSPTLGRWRIHVEVHGGDGSAVKESDGRVYCALWRIERYFKRPSGAKQLAARLWSWPPGLLTRFLAGPCKDQSLPLPVKLYCTINTIFASSPCRGRRSDCFVACLARKIPHSTSSRPSLSASQRLNFGESADLVEDISTREPSGFIGRKPEQL